MYCSNAGLTAHNYEIVQGWENTKMYDINGKSLFIGDEVYTPAYGLLIIRSMKEEHSDEMGGALIQVESTTPTSISKDGNGMLLRTHEHRVSKLRSWKQLATEALDVQNACNLSGVIMSFANAIREVRVRLEAEGKFSTDKLNTHPVCVLFADKIAHLTYTQTMGNDEIADAYRWAYDMKEGDR